MFNRFFNSILTCSATVLRPKSTWASITALFFAGTIISLMVGLTPFANISIISQPQAAEVPQNSIEQASRSLAEEVQIDPLNDEDASFSLVHVRQKQRLSEWIARQYRISNNHSDLFVTTAYKTAFDLGIDPHLILAIVALESRFNPNARGAGSATGLMQIVTRVHTRRFEPYGGVKMATDPVVNIKVGAMLLKDLIKQKGSVERAIRAYAGGNSNYNSRVMTQYRKMKSIAVGSNNRSTKPNT